MQIQQSPYTFANIQMLRAFAAILVIMHHTLAYYQAMGGTLPWIIKISSWEIFGVDIFFILKLFYTLSIGQIFNSSHNIFLLLGFVTLLLLCIIFSLQYYKKIEKPINKYMRKGI